MPVLAAGGDPPPGSAIGAAVAELAAGGIVALPTDTVYGLAADLASPEAARRIYEAKGRPDSLALPVLVTGIDQAATVVEIDGRALTLMRTFWPGGLTIVLPAAPGGSRRRSGAPGTSTVGVRSPAHPVPLALCSAAGPLATTSANLHGAPTPGTAAGVAQVFAGAVGVVLDAGPCTGSASTVVDATGSELRLLRPGAVAWEAVLAALR